jgi:signal transduction histidine kinase
MVRRGREASERARLVEESLRPCARLVPDLVHQATQPLTVMQGLLEGAEGALLPGRTTAEYRSLLQALRREVDRLSYMVSRIREMAEIESAVEQELAVPLVQSAKRAVQQMTPAAEPKKVQIQIHAPREVLVRGDPRRLEWGLQKLISGALRRSPKCGKVLVSVSSSGVAAIVRVSDQGRDVLGLNSWPDRLPRCFAAPRKSDGDGLEWALAQWMLEFSGADLVVRNRAKHGYVVTVTLPLADKQ